MFTALSFHLFIILYGHVSWHLMQANCGIPEIAFATFENMEYGGEGEYLIHNHFNCFFNVDS